jgi:hypothetical protein
MDKLIETFLSIAYFAGGGGVIIYDDDLSWRSLSQEERKNMFFIFSTDEFHLSF